MVEKDIEQRIIKKIKGLGLQDVGVYGLWSDSASILDSRESASSKAFIIVKVPTRGFDTFGICEAQFDIVISVVARIETSPDIIALSEPLVRMLTDWNLVQRYDELEDFIVDGFYPGGIQVNQGSGPDIDSASKTWSMTFNITLRGTVSCGCQDY